MVLATGRAPHLTSFGAVVVGGGVLVLMNFELFVCCFPEFRFPPLLLQEETGFGAALAFCLKIKISHI